MENAIFSIFCSICQTRLKRQVLGSNILYYCRNCGCVSSEACLSTEINALCAQEPLSVQKTSSVTDLKLSEDVQKAVVET